jgi:hypothetical protein
MSHRIHAPVFTPPSTDRPSREPIDHANLDPRRRRGVHPRSESPSSRSSAPSGRSDRAS